MDIQRQDIINCIKSEEFSFVEKALRLFEYQSNYNDIYRQFLTIIGKQDLKPATIEEIPFCPIGLFKYCDIRTGKWEIEQTFLSSGTTQMQRSKHHVRDVKWYQRNTEHIWQQYFGPLSDYTFLSLLPNYHANPSSSLLKMVEYFMDNSYDGQQRYFLDNEDELYQSIERSSREQPIVLFGVSFALLSYADRFKHSSLPHVTVIETGGMKKYKKELTRQQLHSELRACFSDARICSEYGMTECLSQMYAIDSGYFHPNDRIRIITTEATDPGQVLPADLKGRINIIDLANYDTLAFLATDDLGSVNTEGQSTVLGRLDSTDLRGCNYLI